MIDRQLKASRPQLQAITEWRRTAGEQQRDARQGRSSLS
jgi:hypothetical protein